MIKKIPGTLKTFVSLNDRPPLQAILQSLWYFVHLIYHGNHNSPTHSLVLQTSDCIQRKQNTTTYKSQIFCIDNGAHQN